MGIGHGRATCRTMVATVDIVSVNAQGRLVPVVAQGLLERRQHDDDIHHDRQHAFEALGLVLVPGGHQGCTKSVEEFGIHLSVVEREAHVVGAMENHVD